MFERLERSGAALAQARGADRLARIAERIEASVPGVAVNVAGEAVTITGHGLWRRYDRSADLRWTIAEACDER